MKMRWIAPVMVTIAVAAGAGAADAQQIVVTETQTVGEPLMMPPASPVRGR